MLLKLIAQEAKGNWSKLLAATTVSGFGNAAVLAVVNAAARTPTSPSLRLFFLFFLTVIIYAICIRYCVNTVSKILESALYKLRLRLADKILRAEMQGLEQIGTAEIHERLSQETNTISQAAGPIAGVAQSLATIGFTALYLWSLSTIGFVLAMGLFGGGTFLYHQRSIQAQEFMRQTSATRMGLFDRLTDMLKGVKELRFSAKRREALYRDFSDLAAALRASTVQAYVIYQENEVLAQLNMFALLAAIVFVMPQIVEQYSQVIHSATAIVIFLSGAIMGLLWALPYYGRADMAAENVHLLEVKLDHAVSQSDLGTSDPWHGQFKELRAEELQFRCASVPGQEPFVLGPLNLTIRAGEIVFIVGGNGSGKSTLVKVLTSLYLPTSGKLSVDGVQLEPGNIPAYRELISAIFGDFHLFKKLYGLSAASKSEVERLLEEMQLASKTTFSGEGFSTLDLSTGQRKRLAMIVALIEDRPIYVLDEWAADQDSEFRQYYYEVLLQDLKRRGKTLIVISHDDRYFHCADRVITMESGNIRSEETHRTLREPQKSITEDVN